MATKSAAKSSSPGVVVSHTVNCLKVVGSSRVVEPSST
jgi:hypothetical protein